jgi:hypothetical protein
MFGPRDFSPPVVLAAVTFRFVCEGGRYFVVMSFSDQDFQKVEINRRQVAGFVQDALPRVLVK